MKISIVVPCFNCALTIEEAYGSISRQSFKDIEIILIDDGSTDETPSYLSRIAAADTRVLLIKGDQNRGVSAARNKGIAAASGEFIFFMDADDVLRPDCLKTLSDAVSSLDIDFVRAKHLWWLSETNETKVNPDEELNFVEALGISPSAYPQIINIFSCWNALFRTTLLRKHKIAFPEGMRLGEDRYFNIQVFEVAKRLSLLNEYTYLWRKDVGNTNQATKILVADPTHAMLNAFEFYSLTKRPWLKEHVRHRTYLSTTVLVEVVSRLTSFSRLLEENRFPGDAKKALSAIFAGLSRSEINLALPGIKGRTPAFDKLYELGATYVGSSAPEEFYSRFTLELSKIRTSLSSQSQDKASIFNVAKEVVFAAYTRAIKRRSPSDLGFELDVLKRSKLVDEPFYRARYPDVAAANMDVVIHYQLHGVSELRDPNEWFSTADYLAQHPELLVTGLNPLFHYANCSSFLIGTKS